MALGLAAIGVLLAPTQRVLVVAMTSLVVVTAWLEAPFLPNHWQLAALVSGLLLVAHTRSEPWRYFSTNARWLFLAFYGFAAFSKLNGDFFEPAVSCARHYTSQALSAVGLPGMDRDAFLAPVPGWVSAAVELSVVPLLLGRRTRRLGVALGLGFHLLISFDLDQHFYDFTAVLMALFALFAGDRTLTLLGDWRPSERWRAAVPGLLLCLLYLSVFASHSAGGRGLAFLLWVPVGCGLVFRLIRTARPIPNLPLPGGLGLVLVAVVVFIGAMPYLGLRTATAWNMYSNLRVHDGETTHFVIPQAASIALSGADFVEILDTDDPALQPYVDDGWLVPRANLRDYLDRNPDTAVTVLDGGTEMARPAGTWGDRQSLLQRKLLFARSVQPAGEPHVCQTSFLPAG